jgi:hypothetical protein
MQPSVTKDNSLSNLSKRKTVYKLLDSGRVQGPKRCCQPETGLLSPLAILWHECRYQQQVWRLKSNIRQKHLI